MGRGYLYNRSVAYEAEVISIFCHILIGAAGAVANFEGGSVDSVTKEAADGKYTIKFKEKFSRLLGAQASIVHDAISSVGEIQFLQQGETLQGDFKSSGELVVQCVDRANPGVAGNPEENSVIAVEMKVRKTDVGPYDKLS